MNFREDQHTELKENYKSGTLVNDIVAFLNTCDGKIYVGIKDDGSIIGVSNINEFMLKIADMLSNQILPSPEKQILIDTLQVEGKDIVVIDVKRGNDLFM